MNIRYPLSQMIRSCVRLCRERGTLSWWLLTGCLQIVMEIQQPVAGLSASPQLKAKSSLHVLVSFI